jgi:hypothetical protein
VRYSVEVAVRSVEVVGLHSLSLAAMAAAFSVAAAFCALALVPFVPAFSFSDLAAGSWQWISRFPASRLPAARHLSSQLDFFWPANFRPIPQKDSAWDAHTAKETENRQGEVGFLRYSPYGP